MLEYGAHGDLEARVACAYLADAVHDLAQRIYGREEMWGVGPGALDAARDLVTAYRAPSMVASFADAPIDAHLDDDMVLVAETFRRFAEDRIMPVAEHVHRTNGDVPEAVIAGVAELGAFGLAIPEEYGGSSGGADTDQLAMVIATEELSRRHSASVDHSSRVPRSSLARCCAAAPTNRRSASSPTSHRVGRWSPSR
jgi:(2S)-methylsuccinyl-CoA dehydrogenase